MTSSCVIWTDIPTRMASAPPRDPTGLRPVSHSVDKDFLTILDERVREISSILIADLANLIGMPNDDFLKYMQAVEVDYKHPHRDVFDIAKRLANPRYEIEWENGLNVDGINLADLLKMLSFESENPKVLRAEIGSYAGIRVRLEFGGNYSDRIKITLGKNPVAEPVKLL